MKKTIFSAKPKKIQKFYGNIKQKIEERKKGIKIQGIEYIKADTGERVHAIYELIPVKGENGLYRVEEKMLSNSDYENLMAAREQKDNIEREKFLLENPVEMENTRRMYMTADYFVIKQLRREMTTDAPGEGLTQFRALVDRQRIQNRIKKTGDKIAKAIYENGRTTKPRSVGYIGGLVKRKGRIGREYNLEDYRAIKVNQSIFNGLLQGNKKLRDWYEER